MSEIKYLSLEEALDVAILLTGDPPALRDLGLLDSAIARPRASFAGVDAYADLWHKGAALLISVVGNHALVDGNKRLGWLCTNAMLALNGVNTDHVSNDGIYDLVMDVARGLEDVRVVAGRLSKLVDDPVD